MSQNKSNKKESKQEISTSPDELTTVQAQREEYLNGWRHAVADLENYKKEEVKRFTDAGNYIRRTLLKELLPILDSLDRAIETQQEDNGLKLIRSQFEAILKNNGVCKITTATGDEFDTAKHNAVGQMPTEDKSLVGKVTEVSSAGYELDGKVIRAANVVIGKEKE